MQGKLPFAGVEWVDSEDVTDDDKPTSDSNLQDETISKPISEKETITSATVEKDSIALSDDKPSALTDSKELGKPTFSGSDDSNASFDIGAGHNMNREELMRAVFEDNTSSSSTNHVTGQVSTQENIFGDSPYNPDDWVNIPNDELI